ncbi:MAG TPA: glycosyltransferase family 2 protein [Candidatus Saccharimonadales bacterium]|nr:glycosyltransferase family 2 protein [Candidatus Saccharimonadales bacterium]
MIEDSVTFICILAIFNLVRMMLYLVGSDVYSYKNLKRKSQKKHSFRPTVSLVVPCHNEEGLIGTTLDCLSRIDYPRNKLQVIIADDGSTDSTLKIVKSFIRKNKAGVQMEVYSQKNNHGKAEALNNAMKRRATGSLIMCLDADSLIAADGIKKAVEYFRDRNAVAMASNVNIIENGTIIGLAQRIEYLISYHMKKAQTIYNIEYIIGGIGSMFRRSILEKVSYYDTNTMTEDIDLTMKIISLGNKKNRVVYAADCITFSEAVPSFKSLIKQRYRWKYGRLQTFIKNYHLFFSTDKRYTKALSWFILPYAIIQELLFILEPLVVTLVIGSAIYFKQPRIILFAIAIISSYIWVNIWSTVHLSIKERARLSIFAPAMYVILYTLSVVEYIALIQTIIRIPFIKDSISNKKTSWVSPERSGTAKEALI